MPRFELVFIRIAHLNEGKSYEDKMGKVKAKNAVIVVLWRVFLTMRLLILVHRLPLI